MTNKRILVIDDDPAILRMIEYELKKDNHEVVLAGDGKKGLEILQDSPVDAVLLDYKMPGMNGLDFMKYCRKEQIDIPVVMISAYGDLNIVVQAIKLGAIDYIKKPFDPKELHILVDKVLRFDRMEQVQKALQQEQHQLFGLEAIIGESDSLRKMKKLISRVARSEATVMITGESGTGKELVARAIHDASRRSGETLICVNCSALPETLFESELFGHEKGAFTDAKALHKGRFELADSGTIFLDEVGDIPLPTQAKLLRVLQEHTFERVGGDRSIFTDVRVISATNRDLKILVAERTFREDLFYRLNVVEIDVPPLRERQNDILPLANHFLKKMKVKNHVAGEMYFSDEAAEMLAGYHWPGNVRELENVVERTLVLCDGPEIRSRDLPLNVMTRETPAAGPAAPSSNRLPEAVQQIEMAMIQDALGKTGGVVSRAARRLGVSERVLGYKIKKYGLDTIT